MLKHLRHHRTLFIIGPSGSGKSSLVVAGLLPRLHVSSYFPPNCWAVRFMRPGQFPVQALSEVLEGDSSQVEDLVTEVLARNQPSSRFLLVIDQFEELFTQADREEQSRFITLLHALRSVRSCTLLIVMRADFYPDLMNSDLWPVPPSQRLEIAPLRGIALRKAIAQPATDVGVRLEAGLLERLLADAADEPGVLPLVQEAMVLLWDAVEHQQIPMHAYELLGNGEQSGLAAAVATKADAVFEDLPGVQQRIARRIFLRLVQFGEGRADTRRQQQVLSLRSASDDPLIFAETLQRLANNRLVILGGGSVSDQRVVDLAHEALISSWPLLRQWRNELREAELVRRRLETHATEWVRLGGGDGGVLDAAELPEANAGSVAPMLKKSESAKHLCYS